MGSEDTTNGGRISVSRDALRAELAEFKLSFMRELSDELSKKADHAIVNDLLVRVAALELARSNVHAAETAMEEAKERVFSRGQKIVALCFLALNAVLSIVAMYPDWIIK